MKKGKIISISGVDGAGKTTMIEELFKYYERRGKTVHNINVNSYENTSDITNIVESLKHIDVIGSRFFIHRKKTREIQNKVLYADNFNKKKLIEEVTKYSREDADNWFNYAVDPLLKLGKILIFDRYFFDEIVYRPVFGVSLDWIEGKYSHMPKPDIGIYLDISFERFLDRNKLRVDSKYALYKNPSKMEEVYKNYRYVASKYNLKIINGNRELENVLSDFISILDSVIESDTWTSEDD